jgi:hypothetical protein
VETYRILTKEIKGENNEENNDTISYKIKNLLGILPTYKILKERTIEENIDHYCIRCKRAVEDWNHVWICISNKNNIKTIIYEVTEKMESKVKEQNIDKDGTWKHKIRRILFEESSNFKFCNKFHDVIKGIVIKELYLGDESIKHREIIREMIEEIGSRTWKEIWNDRCREIIEKEGKRNQSANEIESQEGKKVKRMNEKIRAISWERASEKFVKKVTERWIGMVITENVNFKQVWYKVKINDLWEYGKNMVYKRSKYIERLNL